MLTCQPNNEGKQGTQRICQNSEFFKLSPFLKTAMYPRVEPSYLELALTAFFVAGFLFRHLVALLERPHVTNFKSKESIMATLVVDATKPITIKNPTVKTVDSEGSPKATLPVQNFGVSIENPIGHVGEVTETEPGVWVFNPGDEIDEQAQGTLFFTGEVDLNGSLTPVTGQIDFELEPGQTVGIGSIEPELVVAP